MNHKTLFLPLFTHIYKNDTAAIELSFMLLDVMHIWDDLVDKDKPVSNSDINRAFFMALQIIPAHPLWNPQLATMLTSVYLKWQTANALEASLESTDNDLSMAWMLRAAVFDIFELLTVQLHGLHWAEQCGVAIRKFYGESLKDFLKEAKKCRTQ